jgi:hypothetical protein
MTTAFKDIQTALMQAVVDSPLDLPFAGDNLPFEKPANQAPWAAVFIIPATVQAASVGVDGQDLYSGLLQIDLNYQKHTGTSASLLKADEVAGFFKAGAKFSAGVADVLISSCSRSRGRDVDGWYRVSMSVVWETRINRV